MNNIITNQNFLSVDQKTARNSYDEYFNVDEIVTHQDETVGKANILSFEFDVLSNEVLVKTTKGSAYLDYLVKY